MQAAANFDVIECWEFLAGRSSWDNVGELIGAKRVLFRGGVCSLAIRREGREGEMD